MKNQKKNELTIQQDYTMIRAENIEHLFAWRIA